MSIASMIRRLAAAGAVVTALAAAAPLQAQQPGAPRGAGIEQGRFDPEKRVERRVAMLTQRLDLTAGQQAKVREIFQREDAQVRAAFEQAGFTPGDWQGERGDSAREARGREHEGMRHGRADGPQGDRARGAQQDGAREGQRSQRGRERDGQRAGRDSARTGDQTRGMSDERAEVRTRVEQIRAETDRQLAQVLTPEQLEKYRSMRQQMRERAPRGEHGERATGRPGVGRGAQR